jgi:RNA recognition motif-containing protein
MRFNPGEHYLLQELFSPFGPISRIYIAYDRETGEARGFAFVNFMYKCAREYQLPI